MNPCRSLPFFSLILLIACHSEAVKPTKYTSWSVYGGSKDNIHYSALRQVDTANVTRLRPVWEYHTRDGDSISQIQVNSIIVDSILYGVTPKLKVFALNAATGVQKWVFDPARPINGDTPKIAINACRGLAYYNGGSTDQRLFYSANGALYCIDALAGNPVIAFGEGGKIDLHNDLGRDVRDLYVAGTTPGIIYKDMIIVGVRVAEEAAAAPGHIRAYDVHTGKLRWIFHTIPYPGETGYDTWEDKEAYKHIGRGDSSAGVRLHGN